MSSRYLMIFLFQIMTIHYLTSQSLSIGGGIQKSIFFDYNKEDIYTKSIYDSEIGIDISISISELDYAGIPIQIELNYQKIKGQINTYSGSRFTSKHYNFDIENDQVNLRIYPLNTKLIQSRLRLGFGGEIGIVTQVSAPK